MNTAIRKLFLAEARRLWTMPTIILSALLVLLGWSVAALPLLMVRPSGQAAFPPVDAASHIYQAQNGLLLLATLFVAAGIVSHDTKSGWLRSLLTRPVTRQEYLAVKMLTVSCSIILILVIASVLPLPVLALAFKVPVTWEAGQVLGVLAGLIGQCFTFVAMCSALSCLLPGVANVAFLFVWQFLPFLVDFLVNRYFWSNAFVYILKDIIFPERFMDAARQTLTQQAAAGDYIWGLGILALFLSLSFWLVNRIQVDRTTD